jgi:CheY-like chemotaxis protein
MTMHSILLVEDDANDIFFMRNAIKKAGLLEQLHVAEDGQHAIDYLAGDGKYGNRERFPVPDLVLLDLKLPCVMGIDVLRWIRLQPALELVMVVVLTSSRLEPDMRASYRAGANSYLVKPNGPQELLAMVTLLANYWLNLNQPTAVAGATAKPISWLTPAHAT